MKRQSQNQAFTIIELVVVVAVIAILATILVMSYTAITNNVQVTTLKADLTRSASNLAKEKAESGSFPADLAAASEFLEASDGVSFEYSYDNTNKTFCMTGHSKDISYFVLSGNVEATEGGCAGHGRNGLLAITNLVKNPKGVGSSAQYYSSGWFYGLCSANTTDTPGVSWGGKTNWHRLAWNGSGCSTMRISLDPSDLQDGKTYRVSALVGNSTGSPASFTMDFSDEGGTSFTIPAGTSERVSFAASRSTYTSVYSFIDLNVTTSGSGGVLVSDVMATEGDEIYAYADGGSDGWVWNGVPNASTSSGPQL